MELHESHIAVIEAINSFHYPARARGSLASDDIQRLLAADVDGFQIDSWFEYLLRPQS